jgi:hypothetical protein
MALYMETTKIQPERTAQEVCSLLAQAGAQQVVTEYVNKKVTGLRWTMQVSPGTVVPFSMPVRTGAVFDALRRRRSPRFRLKAEEQDREQAERVAWRQLLRWTQAQLAFIETGMVSPSEVFMPYIQGGGGMTLYEALSGSNFKMLPEGKRP